jgi:hypothetical protein
VLYVRRERLNGPVRFMTWDNLRHQGCLLICAVCILTGHPLLALFVILVDASFGFVRRHRMTVLVTHYMNHSILGGRRKTDPQLRRPNV